MFDVVIVGGNLAGVAAAIHAAKKGVNVALIEKNKEPFFPAHCGEAIDDVTAEWLDLDKMSCMRNEIKNVIVNLSLKKEYIFKLKKHRLVIFDRNCVENMKSKKLVIFVCMLFASTFFSVSGLAGSEEDPEIVDEPDEVVFDYLDIISAWFYEKEFNNRLTWIWETHCI